MTAVHVVGRLGLGAVDVVVRTNSAEFAAVASEVFADLRISARAGHTVVFDTVVHAQPQLHWSIHRDGEPCELQLRDDAVIVQQQWEFNRLVIERQRAVIHAAAVTRGGRAMLMAGPSHSGKTTLAAWFTAHHAFQYLTDEASAIDAQACVRPYPRPLGLRADSPMAKAALGPGRRLMPEEVLVPASGLGGTVARDPSPVQLIVFPRFEAGSTLQLAALNQADALERLAHLTPGLVRHGQAVFARLTRLVSTARAVEITYPHVGEAAEALIRFGDAR